MFDDTGVRFGRAKSSFIWARFMRGTANRPSLPVSPAKSDAYQPLRF